MSSWTYPIDGGVTRFANGGDAEFDADVHYFTRAKGGYSPSGCLRAMALWIDQLDERSTVEAIMVYPELRGWSGMVAVYRDRPAAA